MIELRTISTKQITFGDRFRDEYGDLDMLAASLKKEGQIQPLAVKALGDDKYFLLAGGRRFKACEIAGITEVAVRVYPESLSEMEMRSIELMENVARKDLSWIEATNLRKQIHDLQTEIHGKKVSTAPGAEGVSQADTARLLGISPGALADDIKLANAVEVFPELKGAKNKFEATKMLKKLQEEIVMAEISSRMRSRQAETPTERLRADLMSNYILKDFFEGVRKVPDNSIDIIEIDPPYAIDLKSIKRTEDSMGSSTKNYNEVPVEKYLSFLDQLFHECYRVMTENSWLICWFAQEPWFEIVYQSLRRQGLQGSRIPGIWNKENSPGQTMQPAIYMANTYECFFYMRKGSPSITRQGRSNVFSYKTVSAQKKIHPTERPIELVQELLQTFAWEGCRLMVPFLGSGNTLLAASNLGITAFGYDLSEEYRNAYIIRVNEAKPGLYRSYREEVSDVPF
jgi:ParB/RepB/Spo0J family partition protein